MEPGRPRPGQDRVPGVRAWAPMIAENPGVGARAPMIVATLGVMPLIEIGKKAPTFTLPDQSGEQRSLKDWAGKAVVLFFYPKDDTSDCTKEACAFDAGQAALKRSGAVVVGISILDAKSKAKFANKHGLTIPLLADEDAKVAQKYGVWQEKSMYGRKYMGIVRTTYLIGPDGKVARRWDKVSVTDHAAEVLGAVKELKAEV